MKVINIPYVKRFQHETFHNTGTKTEEIVLESDWFALYLSTSYQLACT